MEFSDKQQTATIDVSSSGNNTLIAAPSAGRIAVDHIQLIPEAAVEMILKSGSTNLEGPENFDPQQAKTIENVTKSYEGIYKCGFGDAFVLNLSDAVQVSGYIVYRVIDWC